MHAGKRSSATKCVGVCVCVCFGMCENTDDGNSKLDGLMDGSALECVRFGFGKRIEMCGDPNTIAVIVILGLFCFSMYCVK